MSDIMKKCAYCTQSSNYGGCSHTDPLTREGWCEEAITTMKEIECPKEEHREILQLLKTYFTSNIRLGCLMLMLVVIIWISMFL